MLTTPKRILLSVPHMSGTEQMYVREAFESNWLSTVGPHITAFEGALERRVGLPAAALSSGTAAIHLGLRLLGVGPGDEVLCPTLTFAATCNPVRYLGAEPVFLDSEPATWGIDPNLLEDALRGRAERGNLPRAVVVVHLYGQCADMDPILEVCGRYGVPVLEDAAQALGATYKGRAAGTMGDVGIYSFNGNKIVTTTGGGALVSRNPAWVEKARFWSQQARDPGVAYEHSELGYNYRMSNVLAGIGRGQLEVLDQRVEQRRAIAFRYRDALADVPGIALMPQSPHGLHTNWLSCFLIDEREFGCSRDELIAALDREQIETRPVWKPMHLQPLYRGCECHGGAVAEALFHRGICLPSSSSLSSDDQLRVIDAIRRAAGLSASGELDVRPNSIENAPRLSPAVQTGAESRHPGGELPPALIEELLGRSPAALNDPAICDSVRNRVVLVTGAAGSIGSELCTQIARSHPAAIVAFDIAESPLFELDLRMRSSFPDICFRPEIGNIQSPARLDEILRRYQPSMVYHAAAYKHVPLMEAHIVEAVENNVLGTCNVASAAADRGVERFVLISSDKAVRPANIMGATKRMAEMALTAMRSRSMTCVAVRFGNVLESNGSVIPIFRKQIAAGGPVTVTDPEMRRYFMTNSEACRLVLQAGAMGQGGSIYVVDMGRQVSILDLAQKMIRACSRPDQNIQIDFTGRRPGEKLSEELHDFLEHTVPTEHQNIRMLVESEPAPIDTHPRIKILRELCARRDVGGILQLLKETVEGYTPSPELLSQMGEADPPLDPPQSMQIR
ncbi:MAG TPA: aminotransferase class I/II-fold pyridoxal phosphate-dependent enzyme [Terracidiphilus sp.]|jgi:pyridoxal phosphate-dependent aminotransferase EpsN